MKQEDLKNVKLEQELNEDELDQAAGGFKRESGINVDVDTPTV